MSSIHGWLLPAAVALALATPVSAQWKPVEDAGQSRNVPEAPAPNAATDFALLSASDTSIPEATARPFVAPPLPGVERTSRDVALMIVGGTALILGAVIGDDAGAFVMVGGAVVGLVGLYQYLR
jgi:hypothetical protein